MLLSTVSKYSKCLWCNPPVPAGDIGAAGIGADVAAGGIEADIAAGATGATETGATGAGGIGAGGK